MLVLVFLASSLDGALVVRIEPHAPPRFGPETFALFAVGAGGGAFGEEEGEELVGDGEVGGLLELLEGEQTEEGFEEGEGGFEGGEGGLGGCVDVRGRGLWVVGRGGRRGGEVEAGEGVGGLGGEGRGAGERFAGRGAGR